MKIIFRARQHLRTMDKCSIK